MGKKRRRDVETGVRFGTQVCVCVCVCDLPLLILSCDPPCADVCACTLCCLHLMIQGRALTG